jgi:DNA-binding GntR family transcriptional regulator
MATVQQEVYETIRGQLLAGRYSPGQKMGEQRLAATLGVNRNPVREALLKLAGEGLLHRQAGVGCRVAKLDVELFRDVWQLRESVEGMAARLAAGRIKPVEIIRLEHQNELIKRLAKPGLSADLIEADNAFHLMILDFSGNKALREVWRQYLGRIVAMQMMLVPPNYCPSVEVHEETLREHVLIIDALKAHDPDTAERVARGSLVRSLQELLEMWRNQTKTERGALRHSAAPDELESR